MSWNTSKACDYCRCQHQRFFMLFQLMQIKSTFAWLGYETSSQERNYIYVESIKKWILWFSSSVAVLLRAVSTRHELLVWHDWDEISSHAPSVCPGKKSEFDYIWNNAKMWLMTPYLMNTTHTLFNLILKLVVVMFRLFMWLTNKYNCRTKI